MGHAGGMGSVLLGVLVGRVGGDLWGNVFANSLGHPIGVCEKGAELLVESLQDVAKPVELGFRFMATPLHRDGADLCILIR